MVCHGRYPLGRKMANSGDGLNQTEALGQRLHPLVKWPSCSSTSAFKLIDVREPDEHAAGRIAGDRLIALGELTAEADSIDRARPVIFYCRSGSGRSAMATEAFAAAPV